MYMKMFQRGTTLKKTCCTRNTFAYRPAPLLSFKARVTFLPCKNLWPILKYFSESSISIINSFITEAGFKIKCFSYNFLWYSCFYLSSTVIKKYWSSFVHLFVYCLSRVVFSLRADNKKKWKINNRRHATDLLLCGCHFFVFGAGLL